VDGCATFSDDPATPCVCTECDAGLELDTENNVCSGGSGGGDTGGTGGTGGTGATGNTGEDSGAR